MEEVKREKAETTINSEKDKRDPTEKTASLLTDILYSKKKSLLILTLLTVFGFLLRLMAALNLSVFADDMLYASQSAGVLGARILSTHSNPPLFFYLTDLAYNIIGPTTLASRIWPLIFGTLLIPLSYLIAKKFVSERVALFTALFVTLSTFLIKMTFTEHTLVVLFFSMFALYYGVDYLQTKKVSSIIISGVLFGLGSLTKYSAPFFLFAFLIFSMVYLKMRREKIFTKRNVRNLVIFAIIILIFASPFLVFNYLLYKDKGIVDVYFSRVVQTEATQELYGGLSGQENSLIDNLGRLHNYNNIQLPFRADLLIALFSIFGLFLLFTRKQRATLSFLLIILIVPFILQSGGSSLHKHFGFMMFLLAIPAGIGLDYLYRRLKTDKMILLIFVIIILLLVNLTFVTYGSPKNYLTPSGNSQVKSYLNEQVQEQDLIALDPRIYTAQSFWLATDNHFLVVNDFIRLYTENVENQGNIPTDIYIVECLVDDCGWGTISRQPEFNESVEGMFSELRKGAIEEEIFYQKTDLLSEREARFSVFKIRVLFNPEIVEFSDAANAFYFAPYLYKNERDYIFNYDTNTTIDRTLNGFSYIIIILSMFLSFASIWLLFHLVRKQKNY